VATPHPLASRESSGELSPLGAPLAIDARDEGPDIWVALRRGVSRSRAWVIGLIALGATAGLAAGILAPNTFASHAKLYLRAGAREQVTAESMVGLDENAFVPPPTMADELQMLSDAAIYERVALAIGPRELLRPADPAELDDESQSAPARWLHALQSRLLQWRYAPHECSAEPCTECLRRAVKVLNHATDVGIEPGSNVIALAHVSTSPEKARDIAQALIAAFIERHREQFSIQGVLERCREKVAEAKKRRDDAAAAYIEHLNRGDFEELEPETPGLVTEISALETELFNAQVRRKAIAKQRDLLAGRVEPEPVEVPVPGTTVMIPNEEYETQLMMKRSLLAQKQALALENRPIEDARRRTRILDEQISEVDEKLRATPKTIAQKPQFRENAGLAPLSTRTEDLDLEDESLAIQVELLEQRIAEKRAALQELRKRTLVGTLLRKDLEATRDAEESRYKRVLERASAVEALGNIDVNDDANLRVLQAPTLELEKVGPKRFSLLLKGLLAGLVAAIAFALLRRRFDPTLAEPELFEAACGVPVLGVVPLLPSAGRSLAR
jgi:uncharacterized protein involved in exopolysaccharide biosynthesis